ncbi:MAG TPA: hypothetical protein VK660_02395 [Xanthomonadaceae bacterium]|jgi:Ax21 family sulfation-dependent quorum factor|nr:hypothetical protein [Xanthomonadaceae bacterium]
MKRILLAILAISTISVAAQANDLSYNYVQAGYVYGNSDSGSDSHSWTGQGSAAIGEHFDLFGGVDRTFRDGSDAKTNGWGLGGGFHTPVASQTDFVANVSYGHSNVEGVTGNTSSWTGDVGVRSALAPQFEGWINAGYSHGDFNNGIVDVSGKGQVIGNVGGQYKLNKNWGLVSEVTLAPRGNQAVFFGPRVSF